MSDLVMNVLIFGGVALGFVLLVVVYISVKRDPIGRVRERTKGCAMRNPYHAQR